MIVACTVGRQGSSRFVGEWRYSLDSAVRSQTVDLDGSDAGQLPGYRIRAAARAIDSDGPNRIVADALENPLRSLALLRLAHMYDHEPMP